MTTENAPASMYRTTEGLGVWEHKGKVAAVGIGHSPTTRRWDGTAETTMGANSIFALRQAIEERRAAGDNRSRSQHVRVAGLSDHVTASREDFLDPRLDDVAKNATRERPWGAPANRGHLDGLVVIDHP